MRFRFFSRLAVAALAAAGSLASSGCARGPDTEYGWSRGTSLNGTSVFASMLGRRGHELQTAIRLTGELEGWAQGIVRFAPYPGPPARDEAAWYSEWLAGDPNRWLIYVVRDFDTEAEYWKEVREGISETAEPDRRAEAQEKRTAAADWVSRLPPKAETGALPGPLFAVEAALVPPRVCTRLSGPWAEGIVATAAALTLHEPLRPDRQGILLEGDGKAFVLEKSWSGAGRALVIANGSFLLNEALVKAARRPLAERVLEWPASAGQRVALVEGSFVLAGQEGAPNLWDLLKRLPVLRWIAIQLGLAGLLAALARAPRLGRPRPDPVSGADRPAAHAEALGALLARAGAAREAHDLLDRYRHWRHPQNPPGGPSICH
ncbi:MAG: hypothetical protein ACHRXM_06860 [Isosphaerales bacterium]